MLPQELQKILDELNKPGLQNSQEIINFLIQKRDELSGEEISETDKANERCNVINTINYAINQLQEPEQEEEPSKKVKKPSLQKDITEELKPTLTPDLPMPKSFPQTFPRPQNSEHFLRDIKIQDKEIYLYDVDFPESAPRSEPTPEELEEIEKIIKKMEEVIKESEKDLLKPEQKIKPPTINSPIKKIDLKDVMKKYPTEPSRWPIDDSESIDAGEDGYIENLDYNKKQQKPKDLKPAPKDKKKEPEEAPEQPKKPDLLQRIKEAFDKHENLKCYGALQDIEINFCLPEIGSSLIPQKPKAPFSKNFC